MRISGYVNQADHPGSGSGSHEGIKDRFNAALLNARHGSSHGSCVTETDECRHPSPAKCKSKKSKKSGHSVKSCKSAKSAKSAKSCKSAKSAKSCKSAKSAKSKKSKKSRKSSKHC